MSNLSQFLGGIGVGGTTSTASITLTNASPAAMTVTPATPGLYVTLPNATTCPKGDNLYSIYNAGDFDYGVKDSAGAQLGWVRPKTGAMIGLSDSSTAAGVWAYYGLEKIGTTAVYSNATLASAGNNSTSMQVKYISLDADRVFLLFGGNNCYGVVYNKSSQTWGSPTLIKAGMYTSGIDTFAGAIKSATDQILLCTCLSDQTSFQIVTLTISGLGITVNTPVNATIATAAYLATGAPTFIAVSTSFVVMYAKSGGTEIRAITVSGTVPTVGAAQVLSAGGNFMGAMYVSGSIVRTVLGNVSSVYCQPFTVSGSTLTPGTAASYGFGSDSKNCKSFINGNGNIVCYASDGASNVGVAIFKLTTTTEAVTSVASVVYGAATGHVNAIQISATKAILCGTSSGGGIWRANIITDTAGTVSVGTPLNAACPNTPTYILALGMSGNTARFIFIAASAFVQVAIDCAGASPVLQSQQHLPFVNTSYQLPSLDSSDRYNARAPSTLIASGSAYAIGSGYPFALQSTPGGFTRVSGFDGGGVSMGALTGCNGASSNDSWFAFPVETASAAGVLIKCVECAA